MHEFVTNIKVEQIKTLSNFVNAQLSFYQDAARILSDLHGELEMRLVYFSILLNVLVARDPFLIVLQRSHEHKSSN